MMNFPVEIWSYLFQFLSWSDRIRLEAVCSTFKENAWRLTLSHMSVQSLGSSVNNAVLSRVIQHRGLQVLSLELAATNALTNTLLLSLARACPSLERLEANLCRAAGKKASKLQALALFQSLLYLIIAFPASSPAFVPALPPRLLSLRMHFRGQRMSQHLASSCAEAMWTHSHLSSLDIAYPCCTGARRLNPAGFSLRADRASMTAPPLDRLAVHESGLGESCSLYWCIYLGAGMHDLHALALTGLALSDCLLAEVLPALGQLRELQIHAPRPTPLAWHKGRPPHGYLRDAITRFGGGASAQLRSQTAAALSSTHVTSAALVMLPSATALLNKLVLSSIPGVSDLRPLARLNNLRHLTVAHCPVVHPLPPQQESTTD